MYRSASFKIDRKWTIFNIYLSKILSNKFLVLSVILRKLALNWNNRMKAWPPENKSLYVLQEPAKWLSGHFDKKYPNQFVHLQVYAESPSIIHAQFASCRFLCYRTVEILTILRCAGWSRSSLFAYAIRRLFLITGTCCVLVSVKY